MNVLILKEEFHMDALKIMTEGMVKEEQPVLNIGDTVRVDVRIKEGSRERIQAFEGTIIAKRGSGVSETFTVRRVSYGVGVERVFPVNSPNVTKERSFTTCATASVRLPKSRALSDQDPIQVNMRRRPVMVSFFFILFIVDIKAIFW